jgi:hypothetical protein
MAIFPSDDSAISASTRKRLRPLVDSYSSTPIDALKRNAPTAGAAQSRDPWTGRTKRQVSMEFDLLVADIELISAFIDTYGVAGFTFFDFESKLYGTPGARPARNIGTGDGATLTFTIPAKETSGIVVYVNGVAKTAGVDYNVSVGTGSQGEDQIVFIAGHAPGNGLAVTVAFLGRIRYTMQMAQRYAKRTVDWNRQVLSVTLIEQVPSA